MDFFVFLCQEKLLSVSAIKGYRSAFDQVLKFKEVNLTSMWEISMLLRSFKQYCPPRELGPLEWDVTLILRSLTIPLMSC